MFGAVVSGWQRVRGWMLASLFSLLMRIGAVALLAVAASLGFFYVFQHNQMILQAVLNLAAVSGIGIVAGFSARLLLKRSLKALGLLTALVGFFAGLINLNLLTGWYAGWVLFEIDPWGTADDLNALVYFVLGGTSLWLAFQSWQTPAAKGSAAATAAAPPASAQNTNEAAKSGATSQARRAARKPAAAKAASPKTPGAARRSAAATKTPQPLVFQPQFWRSQWSRLQTGTAKPKKAAGAKRAGKSNGSKPSLKVQAKAAPTLRVPKERSTRPLGGLRARAFKKFHKPVKLVGVEEHRCPYCLELVEEGDGRGVVVCPICHTYHHADCWEVTGTCQVPHKHE